jgi:uncharacterized protein YgiB involved in biofilm formation
MKRSAQIGLLVMGALTTTSAAGYFATNHDRACQERALSNPPGTPPQDCRRSVWYGSGHGSGGSRPIISGTSPSGGAAAVSTPSAGNSAVQRGGFGGFASHIAHAFSGS